MRDRPQYAHWRHLNRETNFIEIILTSNLKKLLVDSFESRTVVHIRLAFENAVDCYFCVVSDLKFQRSLQVVYTTHGKGIRNINLIYRIESHPLVVTQTQNYLLFDRSMHTSIVSHFHHRDLHTLTWLQNTIVRYNLFHIVNNKIIARGVSTTVHLVKELSILSIHS